MKIAIHHNPDSYSTLWIKYCQRNKIQYKIVDAYANDIFKQITDCDAFMWHFHQEDYKAMLFAKQLIFSLKHIGIIVYPDIDTCFYFDDKLGQKYLFEAANVPTAPTHIFYTRQNALDWIKRTQFPKVFKLSTGASSANVRLVKNARQARRLVKKAFRFGFEQYARINGFKERMIKYRNGNGSLLWLLKGFVRIFISTEFSRMHSNEIGYIYFQDFIPNNTFDTRVILIGNRAVAKKRINRPNDFRASGSGIWIFEKEQIDIRCIEKAFEINKKLKMQSAAFDFIYNQYGNPILTEVSYCCGIKYNKGNHKYWTDFFYGYWSDDLQWHKCENVNICDWIIEDTIEKITKQ